MTPRKAKTVSLEQVLAATQPGCGSCKWFRQESGEDWGECWLLPPVPVVGFDDTGEAVQGNARPQVDTVDLCSKWEPSQ